MSRRRQFPNEVAIKTTQHLPRLFREAAQLKTDGTIVHAAEVEILRGEVQTPHREVARHRRTRPTEPIVADAPCYTLIARATEVTVARGGVSPCLFRVATQLETVTATVRVCDGESLRIET